MGGFLGQGFCPVALVSKSIVYGNTPQSQNELVAKFGEITGDRRTPELPNHPQPLRSRP